ncbi:MAG: long-chain fatty acid--CoA ligase [Spirochaetes bacterium]|nr:MAG: long-chain fatty acid--CoA ligase [Spirochaetota bacterium]
MHRGTQMNEPPKWKWTDMQLKTVPQYFKETCDRFPERDAQRFNPKLYKGDGGGSFTYAGLRERVERLASGMLSLGLEAREKVAIMSASSPYWTHADMAISNSGATSVTIYPTLSLGEVRYIINDSKSRFVFVDNESTLGVIRGGWDSMPSLEKVFVMDLDYRGDGAKVMGMGELAARGGEWMKTGRAGYEARWKGVTLDDVFTILYTSGTTGQGKGVILTHWAAASRMEGTSEFMDRHRMMVTENDVTLCFLPLSHIFDRGSCQLLALCKGACIAYADKPGTLLADMQRYNPTWINCVPRLYEKIYVTFQQQMSASPVKKKLFDWALGVGAKALAYRKDANGCYNMALDFDLASRLPAGLRLKFRVADTLFAKVRALFGNRFRLSFSASAGIAPELLVFYYTLGLAVVEGYGSTESFNACVLNPLTACKPGYMGVNANGSYTRVAPDGELEISGAGLFKGYLNKPEEDAASFTADGWFMTGDLVRQDAAGYFKIVDRKKAIICTAVGKNIAPAKIENLFSTSTAVEQIFLVGDERNFITALIVPNFNYFIDTFKKANIPFDDSGIEWSTASGARICVRVGDDFVSVPLLVEAIARDVKEANGQLEGFEHIKKYTVLKSRFTEANGQLTPTQKAKKRVILEAYKDVIDGMYS